MHHIVLLYWCFWWRLCGLLNKLMCMAVHAQGLRWRLVTYHNCTGSQKAKSSALRVEVPPFCLPGHDVRWNFSPGTLVQIQLKNPSAGKKNTTTQPDWEKVSLSNSLSTAAGAPTTAGWAGSVSSCPWWSGWWSSWRKRRSVWWSGPSASPPDRDRPQTTASRCCPLLLMETSTAQSWSATYFITVYTCSGLSLTCGKPNQASTWQKAHICI